MERYKIGIIAQIIMWVDAETSMEAKAIAETQAAAGVASITNGACRRAEIEIIEIDDDAPPVPIAATEPAP